MRRVLRQMPLIVVAVALSSSGSHAQDAPQEVWTVKHGQAEGVWTVRRTSETSFSAEAKIDGLPPFRLLGHIDSSGISGISSYPVACNINAKWTARTELVGQARCGALLPWSAHVPPSADPADIVLLRNGQELESTELYKKSPVKPGSPIDREAGTFQDEMRSAIVAAQRHDLGCMRNQFVLVRLQRPSWAYSAVKQKVLPTCVNAEAVKQEATARCRATYPQQNEAFCSCYAVRFTDAYVKTPYDNADYFTQVGLKVVAACKN